MPLLVLVPRTSRDLPATTRPGGRRFDFRRVSQKEIVTRLQLIAQVEGVTIEEPALALIAGSADGSVRDAESILDQLISFASGPITAADVVAVLGIVEEQTARQFADAIFARQVGQCLALVSQVVDEGKDVRQATRTLIDHFRDLLVVTTGARDADLLDTTASRLATLTTQAERTTIENILRTLNILSATESEARFSPHPRLLLEIALIRLCRPDMDPSLEGLPARVQSLEQRAGTPPTQAPPTDPKPPRPPAAPDTTPPQPPPR